MQEPVLRCGADSGHAPERSASVMLGFPHVDSEAVERYFTRVIMRPYAVLPCCTC